MIQTLLDQTEADFLLGAGDIVGGIADFPAALQRLGEALADDRGEQGRRGVLVPMQCRDLRPCQPDQRVAGLQGMVEEGEFVVAGQRRQP